MIDTPSTEVFDAHPVFVSEPAAKTALVAHAPSPAVQAVALATGGLVAGAALAGLLGRRSGKRRVLARPSRRSSRRVKRGAGELVQIVGSRSLLVDVHLLGPVGRNR